MAERGQASRRDSTGTRAGLGRVGKSRPGAAARAGKLGRGLGVRAGPGRACCILLKAQALAMGGLGSSLTVWVVSGGPSLGFHLHSDPIFSPLNTLFNATIWPPWHSSSPCICARSLLIPLTSSHLLYNLLNYNVYCLSVFLS